MATRQEKITSATIAITVFRLGGSLWDIECFFQKINPSKNEVLDMPFSELKEMALAVNDIVYTDCLNIEKILGSHDSHVNNGIDYFKLSRSNIDFDTTESKRITAISGIESMLEKDVSVVIAPFEKHIPKVDVPLNYKKAVAPDVFFANSINDIFDAISYEMQGINSGTGKKGESDIAKIKQLIEGRLLAIKFTLSNLSKVPERDLFQSLYGYIADNYIDATMKDLKTLSQHISNQLPKLVLVRRAWAL